MKLQIKRPGFIPDMPRDLWVKWIAFYAALLYSMRHVAHFFNSMDMGWEGWGWIAAFAIDATIAAAAHGSDKQQRGAIVTSTVVVFTILSIFANLDYTLANALGEIVRWDMIWTLDVWQLAKAVAVASPPLLIFGLAEILKETDGGHSSSTALVPAGGTASTHSQPSTDVTVEGGASTPRQPRRLKRPTRGALPLQPASTMPRLNPQSAPSTASTPLQPPSTNRKVETKPIEVEELNDPQPSTSTAVDVEVEDVAMQNAVDAVRYFALSNNLSEVARQQGTAVETVRKRIRWLWRKPERQLWVEAQIPQWVEENQDFLNKKS